MQVTNLKFGSEKSHKGWLFNFILVVLANAIRQGKAIRETEIGKKQGELSTDDPCVSLIVIMVSMLDLP